MNNNLSRAAFAAGFVMLCLGAGVFVRLLSDNSPHHAEVPRALPLQTVTATSTEERFVKVWVGEVFPDFEVRSLDGSRTYKLSRDRDPKKFTIITFHSPDCPCAANCAELINEMAKAGAADYEIVGILAGKPMDEDFYRRTRAQVAAGVAAFPLYDDPDGRVRDLAGAKRTPTVWVLDREGRVAFVGAPENTLFPGSPGHRYLLREAVEALRVGMPPKTQSYLPLGCPIDPTAG